MSELVLRSQRRVPLPASEREWGSVGLPGLSSALGFSPESSGNGYLSSLYAGPLLLCAAAGAFAEEQRRRLALLLGAVAVAGILVSMAAPPGPWLRSLPLLDRIRYPAKALAWTFFALPMLAGIGADSLRFAPGRRRALLLAAIALGGSSLLLFSRQPLAARLAEGIGLAALAWLAAARAGETLRRRRAIRRARRRSRGGRGSRSGRVAVYRRASGVPFCSRVGNPARSRTRFRSWRAWPGAC